jgi:hypothetical protein
MCEDFMKVAKYMERLMVISISVHIDKEIKLDKEIFFHDFLSKTSVFLLR